MSDLLGEAIRVAYGEEVPRHTRAEYEAEMARLVIEEANDEAVDYVVAYAALCATSDQRLDSLYKAAAIAELWADLRPNSAGWDQLATREAIRLDLRKRREHWTQILRMAKRIRRSGEDMRAATERLIKTDFGVRTAYALCLQERP